MRNILKPLFVFLADIVETIIISVAIFFIVYIFLIQPHRVQGDSMLPNFINGELILTDKISYRFKEPKRAEVIVFRAPTDPNRDFIKRIIGLPGETLMVEKGKVYINGEELKQSFLPNEVYTNPGRFLPEGKEVKLDAGQYVAMGDNRNHSSDSREWGTITKSDIIGRAWLIYWPLERFSLIGSI